MEINIAYWANENYSEYAYISVLSAIKNIDKSDTINCFLITTLDNKRIEIFKNLKNIYSNFQFNPIIINDNKIKNIQMSKEHHITYHCFYRFYINKIKWIKKIIYLDCDTLVIWNIKNLFNKDISKYTVWVVSDVPHIEVKKRIKTLNLNKRYFNSWVMLINLDKRKENKISEQWLKLIKENTYQCWDQDALNIILENQCKYLEWIYNVQTEFLELNENNFHNIGFDKDYYDIAVKDPKILHFTLAWKPRDLLNNHPRRWDYDKMRRFSIYIRLIHFLNPQITIKDFIIITLHTFENILFPKYDNKKLVRNNVNKVIHIINNKIHN